MIGGTYLATTGELPLWVLLASGPYALLVTAVLIGKHVDKLDADAAKGIRTLPVMLGREAALRLDRGLMAFSYVLVAALVITGVLGVWTLLILLSTPRLLETLRVFREPQPQSAPPGYPIWPLWYVAWAFRLTRQAGALFVAGLVLNVVYPVYL
jgi:1,4-dihydroxy-2-naphthoate octaprenyltransferase